MRTVLLVAVLVVGAVAGGTSHGVAAQSSPPPDAVDSYVVEQGDICQPIEALETDGTVGSLYDYRNHETHPDSDDNLYSSYGTQHLQADDTSILMLHEGTDGTSLVVVHDRLEGQTAGGMVSFDVVGVPPEADWVVRDDAYEGETNMAEWYGGEGWLGASWIWADGRTDGGAINGGLSEEFALTIHPGFNEHSAFHDNPDLHDPDWHDDGRIERWEVLSGDIEDPERTTLSLAEPVTIRTGTCDGPAVTYDRTADGISATIDRFDDAAGNGANDSNSSPHSSDAVQFERLELADVGPAEPIRADIDPVDDLPALPDDRDALSSLAVDGAHGASGTLSFSVDAVELEDATGKESLEADDFVLYEADGDGWAEVSLEVYTAEDGTLRFDATVASVERLAVALAEPPDPPAQNATTSSEPATERDTETTHSETDGSQQSVDADVLSIPAIAVVGVAVTVLCGLLWLYSSRHLE
ncbi:hypothetical protein D8Y22_00725 [Salinadaptatus halalkaliphilus]|uniref:PGF-pre-PGF domain-containing protein n=1 Tax=Salinadaptatus halalkaliphilus TaxID=2419781 RepID=A0A4S3TVH3_9EURY|nr:hypothetical protein [Salinadaptatus halalkaliphilus]THE66688.1 hypothetical protein D8Y22_00725 [Salinadaptatus halalkaliphilus]